MPLICKNCGSPPDPESDNPNPRFCCKCGGPMALEAQPEAATGLDPRTPLSAPVSSEFELPSMDDLGLGVAAPAWPVPRPPAAPTVVVEIQEPRRFAEDAASEVQFRLTNYLDGPCGVTLCMSLYGQGRLVEQDPDERMQCCQMERSGDRSMLSFPFQALKPGRVSIRQLRMILTRPDAESQAEIFELPDRSLAVTIEPAPRQGGSSVVVAGDLKVGPEGYGADQNVTVNLGDAGGSRVPDEPTGWQIVTMRRMGEARAGEGSFCPFPGCGRHLLEGEGSRCPECGKLLCPRHREDERAERCKVCAEKARARAFAGQVAEMGLDSGGDELGELAAEVSQKKPSFRARVWIERGARPTTRDLFSVPRDSKDACRVGDKFSLNVQSARDCYLSLVDFGTSGNVYLLLKNRPLAAGKPVVLSGPDESHEWVVGGPPGVERVKAFFTLQPVDLFPGVGDFSPLGSQGASRDIVARVQTAGVALNRLPTGAWTDAVCEFAVTA